MKTIFLTFVKQKNTKPISITDIRLMPGETLVAIDDILDELGLPCARSYAESIGRSVTPIKEVYKYHRVEDSQSNPGFMKGGAIDEGIVIGVLGGKPGPTGYHIDFFVPDTKAA